MSQESANQFLDHLETDEAFAASLAELREDPAAVQAAIDDACFDVTQDEIRAAFLERFGSELTEEQLESVAGGLSYDEQNGLIIGGVVVAGGIAAAAASAAAI